MTLVLWARRADPMTGVPYAAWAVAAADAWEVSHVCRLQMENEGRE